METLKGVFQEIREKHIVDEILRPRTGLASLASWRREQRTLNDVIVMDLNERISHYRLGLSLLLAGVDTEGHIITIGSPGTYRSFDNLSFCCMGMGDRHADNVFAWYRYSQAFSLNDALYIPFEAKKRAEMAGGVGQSTDILVIDRKGIKKVEMPTTGALEEIYNDRQARGERAEFDKRVAELEVQTSDLETSTS